jgi:hypothetical protein
VRRILAAARFATRMVRATRALLSVSNWTSCLIERSASSDTDGVGGLGEAGVQLSPEMTKPRNGKVGIGMAGGPDSHIVTSNLTSANILAGLITSLEQDRAAGVGVCAADAPQWAAGGLGQHDGALRAAEPLGTLVSTFLRSGPGSAGWRPRP